LKHEGTKDTAKDAKKGKVMRAILLSTLVAAIAFGPVAVWAQRAVTTDVEAKALREMAAAIPLGSRVKAQTSGGRRVDGTLMSVTSDAVIIKKNTRVPEPAVTVPFAELARLELQRNGGLSAGKIVGIGLATGAGAILTLIAFFAALGD
jgi:hypothetical protein